MKKALLILCFVVSVVVGFAQKTLQQKNDSVCHMVEKYWAGKSADKIYDLGGEEFRKQLSLADFRIACTQNLFPKGNMKTTFEVFDNGTSKYKAVFTSSDSLSFFLSLDDKNKLGTFLFQPYQK